MMIDFALLSALVVPLLRGCLFSVIFTGAVCLMGGTLAILLAYLSHCGKIVLTAAIDTVSLILRGFPLLVLIYFIYYGIGSIPAVRESLFWPAFSSALFCVLLAFTINHAVFVLQIIVGGLRNLPRGISEASMALGMTRQVAFLTVELPLAFRLALPAYRNELIMCFKTSSLVSIVTLTDLMSVAKASVDQYFDPVTPFVGAAVCYWLIAQILHLVFDRLDRVLSLARSG